MLILAALKYALESSILCNPILTFDIKPQFLTASKSSVPHIHLLQVTNNKKCHLTTGMSIITKYFNPTLTTKNMEVRTWS